MKIEETLKKLEGTQTIETVMDSLSVNKQKAIYYLHRLRKKGYVKTKKLSNNKRVYNISFENKLQGTDYKDIINKNSPIKIVASDKYRLYGKSNIEEVLILSIKKRSFRTILASLALFKKVKNWSLLYNSAKKDKIEREVGALYDLTRKIILTRKMPKRFRTNSLPKKDDQWKYIIPKLKSDDFKNIEKLWRVYLPFNKRDLVDYKK